MTLEKFRGIGNQEFQLLVTKLHTQFEVLRPKKLVFSIWSSILGMHGVGSAESRFCGLGFISGTWCGTPKMQILKCLRIGPVVSARDRM
jgi:hypothetical protein